MPSLKHTKIPCETCGKYISKNNIAIHRERHGITSPLPFNVIRESDSDDKIFVKVRDDTPYPRDTHYEKGDDTPSHYEKRDDTPYPRDNQYEKRDDTPYQYEKRVDTSRKDNIQNIKNIEDNVQNKIENFDRIIEKIIEKVKHNSNDIHLLKLSNNTLVGDVKAMKDELTRQHRGMVRVSNEYHNGHSTSRKDKIRDVVKSENVSNTLKAIESITGALKMSIDRTDERLSTLLYRMDKMEADHIAYNIRMKSVENNNSIITTDIDRHERRLDTLEKEISAIPKPEVIIQMMQDFLKKEGYDIYKIKKDHTGGQEKELKENNFESEIKKWLDTAGIRNGVLTQKCVKELKTIFDAYAKMGHYNEMMKYINKLPGKITRGPVNLKKYKTREALLSFEKKYKV